MKKPENPVGIKCFCSSFKFKWPAKKICKKTSSSNLKGFDEKAMEGLLQPTLPSLIELDHPFSPSEEAKNFIGVDKRSKKERRPKSGGMSLSVPYHPYTVCLMCGMGQGSHGKRLQRCSHCKTATYCSSHCQGLDWTVHLRECQYLKDENDLAKALSKVNQDFYGAVDGRSLRQILLKDRRPPVNYVLNELKSFLDSSFSFWDPNNPANIMAKGRIESLIKLTDEECKNALKINWIRLSSNLFGTVMIHRVINEQASHEYKFGQNPWFEAYLYNFGEICDRIKLYAILQENGYEHFLPDDEFPLLPMKEPHSVQGQPYFPNTHLKLDSGEIHHCMMCKKVLEVGPLISSHDPDRSPERELPRQVNFMPPRPTAPANSSLQLITSETIDQSQNCLKRWLHIVARIKTLPKEFVCSEECEQHAVYGSIFNSHPLEGKKRPH